MRTWSKDNNDSSFLLNTSIPENPFSSKNNVQVFDASSSGEMLFIINLHTLDSFNVLRSYSMNDNNKIVVTCTGEGRKDNQTYSSTTDDYLKLATDGEHTDLPTVTLTEGVTIDGKIDIYPVVPFGIVQRMKRPIKVNFDKIRKN
jgi:threonine synthase